MIYLSLFSDWFCVSDGERERSLALNGKHCSTTFQGDPQLDAVNYSHTQDSKKCESPWKDMKNSALTTELQMQIQLEATKKGINAT